ncbi:putative inner centromere protein [Rosellinia necatrix]|uniref:Putative inner centromere protein n=1 Tax=Rosellinia necatrix TaxID=77044 RepID=A0A1S7UH30_ROSNE|nr:putative inner centromere protein [Rosellinia necatrix]
MAGRTRMQVGSGPWVAEERSSATRIVQSEVEEFTFSVQNDFDWLNEHMAEVFSENQINVAEIFKTPGKLRGKTPRTVRKGNVGETRVPLSNIFSSTPKGGPNPFALASHGRVNTPRVKIAVDREPSPLKPMLPHSPAKQAPSSNPALSSKPALLVDSGYHGSQSQDAMDIDDAVVSDEATQPLSPQSHEEAGHVAFQTSPSHKGSTSPVMHPSSDPVQEIGTHDLSGQYFTAHIGAGISPTKSLAHHETTTPKGSPTLPPFSDAEDSPSPAKIPDESYTPSAEPPEMDPDVMETALGSPSDGSSPIRPIVRKSSLNFASLPAREPITHKSIGARISRTSHLDQNQTSYYRQTGGKSLGHAQQDLTDEENDDMDIDEFPEPPKPQLEEEVDDAVVHNKTYTQRLQDQINKLGKTQVGVQQPAKMIVDSSMPHISPATNVLPQHTPGRQGTSPRKIMTPGAFPIDDDDWIEPLGTPDDASNFKSPRPGLPKSYTTDVMEGVSGKNTVGGHDFAIPASRPYLGHDKSPQRSPLPGRTAGAFGHNKSASVPVLPIVGQTLDDENDLQKTTSASNLPLAMVSENGQPTTPKSPSRGFNNSPLKQVKNKLSSILKSSRGLLASSAAISAEGKSSLLSPSVTRLGLHLGPSTETLRSPSTKETQPLYPDLSHQVSNTQNPASINSPGRNEGRRTRASIERERAEEKRKKEEAKEARRLAEQTEKLEKAREKEREKAHVFSKEQEHTAAMEKQVVSQRDQEKRSALATPGNIPKSARSSPQKANQHVASDDVDMEVPTSEGEAGDVEMLDAPNTIPHPSVSRPTAPASAVKTRELKRPVKPTKEPASKMKQAPTVIRVNMGSQHSQYHPSNSTLSSNLHDSLSQSQLKSKTSQPSLQTKRSLQSLKSSTSSSGRPKALEAAARRKEQEEREAQRRRDAKAELDRKRAVMQEEERRQEQQRKLDAERQKEEERKQAALQAEAKKNAQRQAMIEKAKQTRAPPPAIRNQPNGPPDYSRNETAPSRPPSRMNSMAPRSQEDASRPINAVLSNASKAQMKRPLPQEPNDDGTSRPGQSRIGNGFQPKESKRMRMSDELGDPAENEKQPSLKGAPVRPSGGFKKDLPTKAMFAAGYTNAPPQAVTRDLFKATVTNQHNSHMKAARPLDMAQVSKGAIPFAPNSHAAGGPSKTPARPVGVPGTKSTAKSAARSSPRFQNGDSIELPEINTDDEDDDDDATDGKGLVADWADSPNLRRALVEQENKNPFDVFGPPAPLIMEEVFSRNKDRFQKFRSRTSSANWNGADGLTAEDIRKDLAARAKMRREGGWSYDMGREMV